MVSNEVRQAVTAAANDLGVPVSALGAGVEVESAGQYYATVDGKPMPLIRWECHYFHRILKAEAPDLLAIAVKAGLANPKAGAIANPKSQQARYDRLLRRGMELHPDAAMRSCSWGVGQVMGDNWRSLGYQSVQHFVDTAISGLDGQIEIMARYIRANHLVDELQNLNFAGFARVYNGPNYKKYGYDTEMRHAYERWGGRIDPLADGMLRLGEKGDAVRDLQRKLQRAGYQLNPDGDFGTATRNAVRKFQSDNGLYPDGVAGPDTLQRLEAVIGVDDAYEADEKIVVNGQRGLIAGASTATAGGSANELLQQAQDTVAGQAAVTGSQILLWIGCGLAVLSLGLLAYGLFRRDTRAARASS